MSLQRYRRRVKRNRSLRRKKFTPIQLKNLTIDLPVQPEFIKSDIQASDMALVTFMALVTLIMLLSIEIEVEFL